MSDFGRKSLADQASETVTPDSLNTTGDKIYQNVTDAGDKVAAAIQPGDSKSTTQKFSDITLEGTAQPGDSKSTAQRLTDQASAAGNAAYDKAASLTEQANQDVPPALDNASAQAGGFMKSVSDGASNVAGSISQTASDYTEKANTTLPAQADAAEDKMDEYMRQAQEAASRLGTSISDTATRARQSISESVGPLASSAQEGGSDFLKQVQEGATAFFGNVQQTVAKLTSDASEATESTVAQGKAVANDGSYPDSSTSGGPGILAQIQGFAGNAVTTASKGFENLVDKAASLADDKPAIQTTTNTTGTEPPSAPVVPK